MVGVLAPVSIAVGHPRAEMAGPVADVQLGDMFGGRVKSEPFFRHVRDRRFAHGSPVNSSTVQCPLMVLVSDAPHSPQR